MRILLSGIDENPRINSLTTFFYGTLRRRVYLEPLDRLIETRT
jgi:hypothetical protein